MNLYDIEQQLAALAAERDAALARAEAAEAEVVRLKEQMANMDQKNAIWGAIRKGIK